MCSADRFRTKVATSSKKVHLSANRMEAQISLGAAGKALPAAADVMTRWALT